MADTMTPSESITTGQVGQLFERFATRCRTNASSLPKAVVQAIMESEGDELAEEMFLALRTRAERRTEMIVRPFRIDPGLTLRGRIAALGRREYVDADVLATMPADGPLEGELVFFPSKRFVPVAEHPAELAKRGLVPHYLAQLQVNIDDPSFADEHPNGMQWGTNSCASFVRWDGERWVRVGRSDFDWSGHWWFAGVRKP